MEETYPFIFKPGHVNKPGLDKCNGGTQLREANSPPSAFFSKYFSSKETQLHWKKAISETNMNKMKPSDRESSRGCYDLLTSIDSASSVSHLPPYHLSKEPLAHSATTVSSSHFPSSNYVLNGAVDPKQPFSDTAHLRHKAVSWDTRQEFVPADYEFDYEDPQDKFSINSSSSSGKVGSTGVHCTTRGHVSSTVNATGSQQVNSVTGNAELPDCTSGGDHGVSSSGVVSRSDRVQGSENAPCSRSDKQHKGEASADHMPHSTGVHKVASRMDSGLCQVCQDVAAGFYCGAFVCEACKKFFIRASKQEKQKFVCLRQGRCKITKESRVQCQYCRFQKCLQLNMYYPGEGKRTVSSLRVQGIPCRVCGAPSSGFHFGALTCEGCKGFFRRMVKEREPGMYKCSTGGSCEISTHTRNMCKACRYQKCIKIGMSVEGSRIGRQPNAVKHAISLEVKKQCMEQKASSLTIPTIDPSSLYNTPRNDSIMPGNGAEDMYHGVGTSGIVSSAVPSSSCLPPPSQSEVKEEHSPNICFTDMELSEVPAGVDIKEEPHDEDLEDQLMAYNLEQAGKELAHMCLLERAKSDTYDESLFRNRTAMWKKQMKHFEFHTQCSLRFAKKVPGYRKLPLDDQVVLMQNAIYPIVVLNHSRTYELDTGFYNFFNFSKVEEARILDLSSEFGTLQEHFKHTGMMAQTMQISEMEYTLLSCLLLFDTECPGLQGVEQVKQLQEQILEFLLSHESKSYADGMRRFGELMMRIGELSLARVQHMQAITRFLTNNPELEVPQLYREMFF